MPCCFACHVWLLYAVNIYPWGLRDAFCCLSCLPVLAMCFANPEMCTVDRLLGSCKECPHVAVLQLHGTSIYAAVLP